jgi:hypothetical protein
MARIVFGAGTAKSPQVTLSPAQWLAHGESDVHELAKKQGAPRERPELAADLSPETLDDRFQTCQQAVETIARELAAAQPDVLAVFGDEDRTLSATQNMPPFSIYWGDSLEVIPPRSWRIVEHQRESARAWYGERRRRHPVPAELGRHLTERLIAGDFDVAVCRGQAEDMSINTSFSFVLLRIVRELRLPLLPIVLNAQYPPNQPSARRCYDFGAAVAAAIEQWDADARVAIVAAGGLSHTMVDEAFDRGVLEAIEAGDAPRLRSMELAQDTAGTGEVRCWIAAAGALSALSMSPLAYVPGYRSLAGTGCGMAFALWR